MPSTGKLDYQPDPPRADKAKLILGQTRDLRIAVDSTEISRKFPELTYCQILASEIVCLFTLSRPDFRYISLRILLVEDDKMLSKILSQALQQSGYAVDPVKDGTSADAALTHDVYDLVLLDLGLPGLDGIEVLKRLRARKYHVPVLIMTARDSLDDRVGVWIMGPMII